MKCSNGPMLMEFTGLHHPEAAGFKQWWNGFLKTQLQYQLGGSTFQGWGMVLQKAVYTLNQHLIYAAVSPIASIHRSRNQGVEMGMTSLLPLVIR